LMVWSFDSQLSLGFETWTRPPTAAMSGATNLATSWRRAAGWTITSESTDTMISDALSRTAWLMPLRLPMLPGLRRTVTLGNSAAPLHAQAWLSSVEQS